MHLRQLIVASGFALTVGFVGPTYAVGNGFYLGIMSGPASNGGSTMQVQTGPGTTTTGKANKKQWASRVFMGNRIGRFGGIEGGLDYFTGIKYETNVPTCHGAQSRIRGFDLLGTLNVPMGNTFEVFGKGGVALLYQNNSGDLNPDLSKPCGKSKHATKFRPMFAVGASVALTPSWIADVSFNSMLVGKPIKNASFVALGIAYHFVDRYCGQFLCDE